MNIRGLIICLLSQNNTKVFRAFLTFVYVLLTLVSNSPRAAQPSALLIATQPSAPQVTSPWVMWKETEHLSVKYRELKDKPLLEIKSQVTIQSSISGFILFIQDTQNINKWLDNAKSSKVLEQVTPHQNTFVTHFKSFWPIKPRYMVVSSHFWQNDDFTLEIVVTNNESEKYLVPSKIKIDVLAARWLVTPHVDDTITIEYRFIADPQGSLPLWLVKRLQLNSIYKTMNTLREQLPSSVWQSHQLPHITELSTKVQTNVNWNE